MIAVALFDVLVRDERVRPAADRVVRIGRLAERLVDAALADWERLLEYEKDFASLGCATPALDDELTRATYGMYESWVAEAEQVLDRARRLSAGGRAVARAEELEDAFGRVHARLALTPGMIAHATEQVRQGQARPLNELRDELRARVRA